MNTPERMNELADWLLDVANRYLPRTDKAEEIAKILRSGEPVYQCHEGGQWSNCDKEYYDEVLGYGCEVRILYTAPQPVKKREWKQVSTIEYTNRITELFKKRKCDGSDYFAKILIDYANACAGEIIEDE